MADNVLVALAGQPNAGKSTVFNMLTGARQHVANYPGVTVEKKTGFFPLNGVKAEVVDLPGAYSLTSYSQEERIVRDFIVTESPEIVVNVVDASNLKRHLLLTFQLLEMGIPVVVGLNMMDVSKARGQTIDVDRLSRSLGVAVTPTVGREGKGGDALKKLIRKAWRDRSVEKPAQRVFLLNYGALEAGIDSLEAALAEAGIDSVPSRWLAVKLLEGDREVHKFVREGSEAAQPVLTLAAELALEYEQAHGEPPDRFIEKRRLAEAEQITGQCVTAPNEKKATLSDWADRLVCHRILGYPILIGVLYLMYYLSIGWGYELTNYTWPALAWARSVVGGILPAEGFATDPMLRALVLWLVDSVNGLLNYVPIFLILFTYIAILEDLGYMPRMAFLLDAFFRRFGLHGQSTLPLVLGGVYMGGCAVPGIMACRAVPDERARLATIMVVPMMNCLAKLPLYVLLVGIYFAAHKGQAMFFIATITILLALIVSKLLTLTVLKSKESAPFIMEIPPYHRPAPLGVLRKALERVWLYVKKITTVVAAVSVVLFVLMQFPGLSAEREGYYAARTEKALNAFYKASAKSEYAQAVDSPQEVDALFAFAERYKDARSGVINKQRADAVDNSFIEENKSFFSILKPKKDKQAKIVNRAYKKLRRERLGIRESVREEIIDRSFLGQLGRLLEPATQYAGFNWRVNIALLAALAAKENTVATLGTLYQPRENPDTDSGTAPEGMIGGPAQGGTKSLENRIAEQSGFTPLHALALMLFMALYPPCMAATMVVKVQSGSWKWMTFSLLYMIGLGAAVAILIFSGGSALGLTGLEAMAAFYGLALATMVAVGLIKPKQTQ